jgi:hypothetical protein
LAACLKKSSAAALAMTDSAVEETAMPETTLYRITELHNLAIHAHKAAAAAHAKGDHLTAHELSKQALEHSMNACRLAEQLAEEAAKSAKPAA